MAYTNSPMTVYTRLSPNHSGQRTHVIDRITPLILSEQNMEQPEEGGEQS